MEILETSFYERDPAKVAKELLGKILVRRLGRKILSGMIVETEAYYREKDPASRAYSGRPKFCVKLMQGKPGRALIYNVHNNWLFNVVAHYPNEVGGVLIRALEPIKGVEIMKKNRGLKDLYNLCNGPGKLSKALKVTKEFNGTDLTKRESKIYILDTKESFEVCSSHRIGVTKDLPKELRFFIKGNKFVSRW